MSGDSFLYSLLWTKLKSPPVPAIALTVGLPGLTIIAVKRLRLGPHRLCEAVSCVAGDPNASAQSLRSCHLILPPNHLRRSVVDRHTSITTLRAGFRDSDILHYLTYAVRNHAQRSLLVRRPSISVTVDFYPTRLSVATLRARIDNQANRTDHFLNPVGLSAFTDTAVG